jgi:uncharacterized membrane protein (UPF0127 family)
VKTCRPSARLRNRAVVALLALGAGLAGLGLWRLVESYDAGRGSALSRSVADAGAASEPFEGLTEARVEVGGEPLRVVVADDDAERGEGLRRRRTLGAYDAMLFAYPAPVVTAFTMSTVPVRLDIAFYDARGRVVRRLLMEPCDGPEVECPSYRPTAEFMYALETLEGDLPNGRLTAG